MEQMREKARERKSEKERSEERRQEEAVARNRVAKRFKPLKHYWDIRFCNLQFSIGNGQGKRKIVSCHDSILNYLGQGVTNIWMFKNF